MLPLMIPFPGKTPIVAADAFIAPDATPIGEVEIGAGSSVWRGRILRGAAAAVSVEEGRRRGAARSFRAGATSRP